MGWIVREQRWVTTPREKAVISNLSLPINPGQYRWPPAPTREVIKGTQAEVSGALPIGADVAVRLDRSLERWLRSQPIMELVQPPEDSADETIPFHHVISRHRDPTSPVVATLRPGTILRVLSSCLLADGKRRARIVLDGSVRPLGWIDATLPNGSPTFRVKTSGPVYEVACCRLRKPSHPCLQLQLLAQSISLRKGNRCCSCRPTDRLSP